VFPEGGEGIYLVVDEKGNFREQQFQRALAAMTAASEETAPASSRGSGKWGKKKQKRGQQTAADVFKIVRMIMERKYTPCIIFSFSKRDCEQNALQMTKLDFCEPDEKKND
jgi:ATP-dependent RNA helicase DOB1